MLEQVISFEFSQMLSKNTSQDMCLLWRYKTPKIPRASSCTHTQLHVQTKVQKRLTSSTGIRLPCFFCMLVNEMHRRARLIPTGKMTPSLTSLKPGTAVRFGGRFHVPILEGAHTASPFSRTPTSPTRTLRQASALPATTWSPSPRASASGRSWALRSRCRFAGGGPHTHPPPP